MKRVLAAFLTLSLLALACGLIAPPPVPTATSRAPTSTSIAPASPASPSSTPSSGSDLFDIPWEDRAIFESGLVASERPILGELPGASVYHMELNIADDRYHLTGRQEVYYTNREDATLPEVYFRLFPNVIAGEMTVSNVTVDGQLVTPQLKLQNSLMIVPLPNALDPGQSTVLGMDFAVTVPQDVESNYGMFAYSENVLALAHAYPMIAVYDDQGWNAEIPAPSGDIVYADVSFFLVKISAPADLVVVTSGNEIQKEMAASVQSLQLASGPARDFYLAASPDYEVITHELGEVTLRSYAPAELEAGAQLALDVAGRALEDFGARYAPYPYTELDIVSTPTLALGIEYPGIVAITTRIYDVNQVLEGTPLSVYMESTMAHEVGHQWFYNLVGGDQLDDPWLDESLTQFATLQYHQDEYGPNGAQGFRNSLERRWANVDRAKIPIGLPVEAYSGKEYSAIVYGRGPLFFIALQEEMGAENFESFLREYTATLSWGIATPEVLHSLAERHCSCQLDALFDEWVNP